MLLSLLLLVASVKKTRAKHTVKPRTTATTVNYNSLKRVQAILVLNVLLVLTTRLQDAVGSQWKYT